MHEALTPDKIIGAAVVILEVALSSVTRPLRAAALLKFRPRTSYAQCSDTSVMKVRQEGDLMFHNCEWLNEPEQWSIQDGQLRVVTNPASDFWRKTHYDFLRDSGHLFGMKVAGDFTVQVHLQDDYQNLCDQAGMMVRIDDQTWIKTGIEVSDGDLMLGSVLTSGHSDWATGLWNDQGKGLWLRITVSNSVIRIQPSTGVVRWPLLRLAPFPEAEHYRVGAMCCSPEGNALNDAFSGFTVTPATGRDLHDLT